MRAAVYARVSTERQERYATIDSQLTALRAWAAGGGTPSPMSTSSATRDTAAAVSTDLGSTRCATLCTTEPSARLPC